MVAGLIVIVSIVLLLTINLKWARIDPHNVEAGPSWLDAFIRAIINAAIILVALQLQVSNRPDWAGFIGSMGISMAFGASISPPVKYGPDEVPGRIKRLLAGVPEEIGGAIIKTVIVMLLTYPVSWLVPHHTAIWITGVLALIISTAKAPLIILLLQEKPPEVRSKLIGRNAALTWLLGTAALAMITLIAIHIANEIPSIGHVSLRNVLNVPAVLGFCMGFFLAHR